MASKFLKTPRVVAGFSHVNRPSKFKKFEIEARFKSKAEAKDIIDLVNAAVEEEFGPKKAAKAKLPFKTDEETGEFIVKCTSQYKPTVYNAKGEKIEAERIPAVYGGSVVRVGIKFDTYERDGKHGITARFQSLQIIKLTSAQSGFENEVSDDEDAYVEHGVDAPVERTPSKKDDADEEADGDATSF